MLNTPGKMFNKTTLTLLISRAVAVLQDWSPKVAHWLLLALSLFFKHSE